MPFCGQCGKQMNGAEAFCTSCGTKVAPEPVQNTEQNTIPRFNTSFSSINTQNMSVSSNTLEKPAQFALFQMVGLCAAAVLQILDGVFIGILINGLMAAGIYFLGYKSLKTGSKGYSLLICVGAAALSGVVGLLGLLKGQLHYFLVYGAAALFGYLIYKELQKAK